jgi:hypothetical protein
MREALGSIPAPKKKRQKKKKTSPQKIKWFDRLLFLGNVA